MGRKLAKPTHCKPEIDCLSAARKEESLVLAKLGLCTHPNTHPNTGDINTHPLILFEPSFEAAQNTSRAQFFILAESGLVQ